MSMNHFRPTKWGRVSGWKGNLASDLADAATFVVEVGHGIAKRSFPFSAEANFEMLNVERALDLAFECGDRFARAEIRKVLGVTGLRQ